MTRFCLCALLMLLVAGTAAAHAIDHQLQQLETPVITVRYADGEPVAFESYELRPPDDDRPFQVGRTDRLGRIAMAPDRPGTWRLKIFTDDGHGLQTEIVVTEDMTVALDRSGPGRGLGVAIGLLGIALLASILMIIERRKTK